MHAAVPAFALTVFTISFVLPFVRSLPGAQVSQSRRAAYDECANSNECAFESCCVLGMDRYSIPHCQKKQQLHEVCRPSSNEAVNTTVFYPDDSLVSLHNVHMIMCPCAKGLVCDPKIGKCAEFDSTSSYNHVHEKEFVDD